jgi:hypothetical protein
MFFRVMTPVDSYVATNVSEKHTVPIFRAEGGVIIQKNNIVISPP